MGETARPGGFQPCRTAHNDTEKTQRIKCLGFGPGLPLMCGQGRLWDACDWRSRRRLCDSFCDLVWAAVVRPRLSADPQQGYPQQSYPPQGYPQQGYPQQGTLSRVIPSRVIRNRRRATRLSNSRMRSSRSARPGRSALERHQRRRLGPPRRFRRLGRSRVECPADGGRFDFSGRGRQRRAAARLRQLRPHRGRHRNQASPLSKMAAIRFRLPKG